MRNVAKWARKWPKNSQFRLFLFFSKTVHTVRTKFFLVNLHHIRVICAMASKSYCWNVRNIAKISPKWPKLAFFRFSQNLSIRFDRNFFYLFYTILESYMCNGIKILLLGCEKQPKLEQNGQNQPFFDFLKTCQYDSTEIFSSYSTPY